MHKRNKNKNNNNKKNYNDGSYNHDSKFIKRSKMKITVQNIK